MSEKLYPEGNIPQMTDDQEVFIGVSAGSEVVQEAINENDKEKLTTAYDRVLLKFNEGISKLDELMWGKEKAKELAENRCKKMLKEMV